MILNENKLNFCVSNILKKVSNEYFGSVLKIFESLLVLSSMNVHINLYFAFINIVRKVFFLKENVKKVVFSINCKCGARA